MQRTICACDGCGKEFRPNSPTEGVTSAFISSKADGSAVTILIDGGDYCRDCWDFLIQSVRDAAKKLTPR